MLFRSLEWRTRYNKDRNLIRFDTPYLKEPLQYDMHILPKEEFLPYFDSTLDFILQNLDDSDHTKFTTLEYEKFNGDVASEQSSSKATFVGVLYRF